MAKVAVGCEPNKRFVLPKFWMVQWPQTKHQQATKILAMPTVWSCQYFGGACLGSNQTRHVLTSNFIYGFGTQTKSWRG